ncbi:MAG: acyl carrier protein [Candidatus Zixiibacteriota bacterium]|nr:MAG: acyl carrier protein [candidate division Zixibacteria bacterium]HHI02073.1 acyl carrier protein [candidate division Zixibacteria bacterium]
MTVLNETTIRSALRAFIMESFLFGNTEQAFDDSDSFMENGIVDSTGILELISFIEEQYNIQIDDEELIPENLDSINNLVSFIARKTAKMG